MEALEGRGGGGSCAHALKLKPPARPPQIRSARGPNFNSWTALTRPLGTCPWLRVC